MISGTNLRPFPAYIHVHVAEEVPQEQDQDAKNHRSVQKQSTARLLWLVPKTFLAKLKCGFEAANFQGHQGLVVLHLILNM